MLTIVAALMVSVCVRAFVVEPFIVPTGSMLPTIQLDERILCEKLSYRFGEVSVGDIICFESDYHDGLILVKRVIATGGQTVDIRDGNVYVDGMLSPWGKGITDALGLDVTYPLTLGEDELWVMGDNRRESSDSRVFGPIPKSCVVGHVFARLSPPEKIS